MALTILKLGNGFAALYTTAVAIVASSNHNILIKVFLPLKAALIPTSAVTPPPPRDPIPGSKEEPHQYQQDESREDRGGEILNIDCQ